MEKLEKKYQLALDNIKGAIQASELLETYLDSEDEEDYKALIEAFEPIIEEVYQEVANNNPLQLIAFEEALLDEGFEGMYLPRVLGYSVLRGGVSNQYKYYRPQQHFKNILLAIANSPNFEVLKRRIGQSIQIGFALSSDIWITSLTEEVNNKKVKYYLESQKNLKYRDEAQRRIGFKKFQKQFESLNYQSAEFPKSIGELKVMTEETIAFLEYRADHNMDNESLFQHIDVLLKQKDFLNEPEFLDILITIGMNYALPEQDAKDFVTAFNHIRKNTTRFEETFFQKLEALHNGVRTVNPDMDKRFSMLVDRGIKDEVSRYYDVTDVIHGKGIVHEDTIEAVRAYSESNEGLSPQNESLRSTIYEYFKLILSHLEPSDYQDYFELNKIITLYINIFNNQRFNQEVKAISLKYVKQLLKTYTDKRGRDYQDIKKFVHSTFEDLGFMDEKELKEFFKTRRKPRTVAK